LQTLVRASYAELAELLFAEREASGMPPFSHLCLIRAEAIEVNDPISYLKQVAVIAKRLCAEHALAVTCLGPLPAPMEKRAGRYRIQLLLNSKNRGAIQNLLEQLTPAISALKHSRKLRWSIDVDPQDLI
jgi:primosomal protein N' (replication factor Y)